MSNLAEKLQFNPSTTRIIIIIFLIVVSMVFIPSLDQAPVIYESLDKDFQENSVLHGTQQKTKSLDIIQQTPVLKIKY